MPGLLVILGSTATAVLALSAYYSIFIKKKPKVYAGNATLRTFLERNVPLLKDKYCPSPLYWEGRMQTILGLVYRHVSPSRFPYTRELFSLRDGGEVGLDFAMVDPPKDGKSLLVLIFPGLTSSSQSGYIRTMVTALNGVGVSVVVFNNRGLGGVPFKSARTYSASNTEDAVEVINYLKQKFPGQRLMALGTSLGGMVLSKYLVTYPQEAKDTFEAALIISIPWDANGGITNLESGWINHYLINKELTKSLVNLAKKFLKTMDPPPGFDVSAVMKARSVRDFDAAVTAPQFGFASVEDYYNSATLKGHTHKFSIPVFCLNAEDDPMCRRMDLPLDEAVKNGSNLAIVITTTGGHLGWLEGTGRRSVHFMERFVVQLISGVRLNGREQLKL